MKVILLANWGLGLEVLKVLHRLPDVDIRLVVTRHRDASHDKWENVVHEFALKHGYRTITEQQSISFDDLRNKILEDDIDLLVSHAFMRILPSSVFSAPKLGTINIHASLLPKYRGPSPAYWVIRNGDKVTGLTCHYIDEGVDTGDVIHQLAIPVEPGDSIGSIIDRQKTVIQELMIESISRITDSNFQPTPQISELATYAPRPEEMGG